MGYWAFLVFSFVLDEASAKFWPYARARWDSDVALRRSRHTRPASDSKIDPKKLILLPIGQMGTRLPRTWCRAWWHACVLPAQEPPSDACADTLTGRPVPNQPGWLTDCLASALEMGAV